MRAQMGLTQQELAEKVGYSHVYIREIESGKNKLSEKMKEDGRR